MRRVAADRTERICLIRAAVGQPQLAGQVRSDQRSVISGLRLTASRPLSAALAATSGRLSATCGSPTRLRVPCTGRTGICRHPSLLRAAVAASAPARTPSDRQRGSTDREPLSEPAALQSTAGSPIGAAATAARSMVRLALSRVVELQCWRTLEQI